MTDGLGERLTELVEGDFVVIYVEGDRYAGEVSEIDRWMCKMVGGFMESGDIAVHIELSGDTIRRHDISKQHLVLTAEEDVPWDWDVPKASLYDDLDEERAVIGELTDIEVTESSDV